jgi:uncharacterized membrane protein
MTFSWRSEIVQLGLIALMFVVAAAAWPYAPDRIAVHWNIEGQADRYGGKFEGLLLTPLVALGLYALLAVLPWFDPGRANYRSFAGAYNLIRVAMVVFMAALYGVILAAAFGQPVDVGMIVTLGTGALMVLLGNILGKIRPNWFVGVRTPWTLSSKLSWDKTHRVAGWVFIALGLLLAPVGIIRAGWYLGIVLAFGAVSLVWLVVYSYLVYRSDPNRVSPAGTSPSAE